MTDHVVNARATHAHASLIDQGQLAVNGGTAVDTTLRDMAPSPLHGSPLHGSTATKVARASEQTISSGVFLYSGSSLISAANTLSGVPVGASEREYLIGGTTTDTLVANGGLQIVSSGGMALGTTLSSGGSAFVSSGGVASDTLVYAGGLLSVDGGTAVQTTVESGGGAEAYQGGTISNALIGSGGEIYVFQNGTVTDVTVSGGVLSAEFGRVSDLVIQSGGQVEIGGSATVSGAQIGAGGSLLDCGSSADNITVSNSGALTTSFTQVRGLVIDSGGYALLGSGTTLADGQVHSGGILIVLPGAEAVDTVEPGGRVVSTGVVLLSGLDLLSAGVDTVSGGEVAVGETAYVLDGGSASFLNVSGGTVSVCSGGEVISASLLAFTSDPWGLELSGEDVLSGGRDIGTFIVSRALQTIDAGGTGTGEIIGFGGTQDLGGVASSVIIGSGGDQCENNRDGSGLAVNTTILNGGSLDLLYRGFSVGTHIEGGGVEFIGSGSVASGTVVSSGGVQRTSEPPYYGHGGGVASGTLVLSGGEQYIGASFGVHDGVAIDTDILVGGTVDVSYQHYVLGTVAEFSSSTDQLTISGGGEQATLQLAGDYSDEYFRLSNDGAGGTDVTVEEAAQCYALGTRLRTDRGDIAVEDLAIGDRLHTLHGGAKPIRWIGRLSYEGRFIAGNHLMLPVCIRADALAPSVPLRDLSVSPGHGIYLDGVLVPAWRLINGVTITQASTIDQIAYLHVELADHEIVLAEGMQAETYLDEGCRAQFANAGEYPALYPQDAAVPRPTACVPRIDDGFQLQALQQRLAARAGIAPPPQISGLLRGYLETAGPDTLVGWAQDAANPEQPVCLDVVVDGRRVLRLLANRYRADVRAAGLGSGCHGFDLRLPTPIHGQIDLHRSADGAILAHAAQDADHHRKAARP